MRRYALALVLLLVLALVGFGRAEADPFTGGGGTPLSAAPSTTPAPSSMPRETAALPGLGLGNGLLQRLAHQQMLLNARISHQFKTVRDTGSGTALAAILALAFLYGVLHAAGPGHGKSIVAAYFVANEARWTSGVVMGGIISLLQGATAIAVVSLLSLVLKTTQTTVENNGAMIEFVSYGLVVLIGLVLFYRAVTGKGCDHHHGPVGIAHDHGHDHHGHEHGGCGHHRAADHHHHTGPAPNSLRRVLTLAAGVAPCASAIIIMLFALANGALLVGTAAVLSLSAGMGLTVSAIGVLSILARGLMMRFAGGESLAGLRLERALNIAGSVLVVGCAGALMLGAWVRL